MNKQGLIDFVANESGTTKEASSKAIDAVFKGVVYGLRTDKKIQLVGFGSFDIQTRSARKARNPQTGAEVDVPTKEVVRFRPGKEFKASVNASG